MFTTEAMIASRYDFVFNPLEANETLAIYRAAF